jgi:signal transduction histidine kinase
MSRDRDLVRLTIEDDGVGIPATPNPARQTFGVSGMRERISTLGGKMTIASSPGHGTRIEVNAPISLQVPGGRGELTASLDADAVAQGA